MSSPQGQEKGMAAVEGDERTLGSPFPVPTHHTQLQVPGQAASGWGQTNEESMGVAWQLLLRFLWALGAT